MDYLWFESIVMVTCTTLETRNIKRDGNGYAFVDMFNFNKIKIVPPAKHVFVSLFLLCIRSRKSKQIAHRIWIKSAHVNYRGIFSTHWAVDYSGKEWNCLPVLCDRCSAYRISSWWTAVGTCHEFVPNKFEKWDKIYGKFQRLLEILVWLLYACIRASRRNENAWFVVKWYDDIRGDDVHKSAKLGFSHACD